eukprot:gene9778-1762_t
MALIITLTVGPACYYYHNPSRSYRHSKPLLSAAAGGAPVHPGAIGLMAASLQAPLPPSRPSPPPSRRHRHHDPRAADTVAQPSPDGWLLPGFANRSLTLRTCRDGAYSDGRSCALLDFNASSSGRALGKAGLAFVGHSLVQETWQQLVYLTSAANGQSTVDAVARNSGPHRKFGVSGAKAGICPGTPYAQTSAYWWSYRDFTGLPRRAIVRPGGMLFCNIGDWLTLEGGVSQPEQEALRSLRHSLQALLHHIKQHDRRVTLVWMANSVGHPGCERISTTPGPWDDGVLADQPQLTPESDRFQWRRLLVFNRAARDFWKEASGTLASKGHRVWYMDSERMIGLRADGHRLWQTPFPKKGIDRIMKSDKRKAADCLHYQVPGPTLWRVVLLHNFLVGQISE